MENQVGACEKSEEKHIAREPREKNANMDTLIYREESFKIVGACLEVYGNKGCGFLEPVYQECLEMEFKLQDILCVPQQPLVLEYKGHRLKHVYEPDFICYGKIILEIKAVSQLTDEHRAQIINYLKATGFKLGLLVNFGHYPKLEWERLANTKNNL
jgi:GxxExxY protein